MLHVLDLDQDFFFFENLKKNLKNSKTFLGKWDKNTQIDQRN